MRQCDQVSIFIRSKQPQLHRSLALLGLAGADEDEAAPLTPALWLPARLEEAQLFVYRMPAGTLFDLLLQLRKALKGHRDGVLNAQHVQRADDLIAEEGAVHAHFEDCGGQDLPHFPEATQDEAPSAVGVVYVAGAMPDIQDLPGLSDGAKQRVGVS